jgi:hypothetical protein
LHRQAVRFPTASLCTIVASLNANTAPSPPPSVPPPSTSHRCLPQRRRHAIAASLSAIITSLNANATLSPPPSVQPPSMPRHRLPQCRCHAVTASLDAAPSPPSMLMPHHCCLPRCSLPQCRTLPPSTSTLPPSTVHSLDFTLFYSICWYCFGCDCIIYWINQLNDDMRCSETRM